MTDNELPKHFRKGKYRTGSPSFKPNTALQQSLNDIDERISAIENRYLKTDKKTSTTRAQQMLLLHHLGFLDKLNEFNISNKKKAKLLSILLNASQDNIEGDLSNIHKKDSPLNTSFNYSVVNNAFQTSGLKELAEKTDIILENIIKEDNK